MVLIKKGEPAKYSGALITIEDLRELEITRLEANFYKSEIDDRSKTAVLPVLPKNEGSQLAVGMGLGAVITATLFFIFMR